SSSCCKVATAAINSSGDTYPVEVTSRLLSVVALAEDIVSCSSASCSDTLSGDVTKFARDLISNLSAACFNEGNCSCDSAISPSYIKSSSKDTSTYRKPINRMRWYALARSRKMRRKTSLQLASSSLWVLINCPSQNRITSCRAVSWRKVRNTPDTCSVKPFHTMITLLSHIALCVVDGSKLEIYCGSIGFSY
uniref:Uncharacterized protein n=1 Tax=Anopheles melas TaxID=34690 RepID=A0A182U1J7_9DIPT